MQASSQTSHTAGAAAYQVSGACERIRSSYFLFVIAKCLVTCRAEEEPPEEFFEFTPDDYHRVVAGQARERARAETGLRTQKLREEEMRRRAAALGPVPIRVHFPDDIILQV